MYTHVLYDELEYPTQRTTVYHIVVIQMFILGVFVGLTLGPRGNTTNFTSRQFVSIGYR